MTHREQINNMSNEELATKLYECAGWVCRMCTYSSNPDECVKSKCDEGISEWLNMEVEE